MRKSHSACKVFVLALVLLFSMSAQVFAAPAGGSSEILVIKGEYDNIEGILDRLGWSYDTIDGVGVDETDMLKMTQILLDYDLTNVKQIYINCGSIFGYRPECVDKIKLWVENGGFLYASDWEYSFLKPWGLEASTTGEVKTITATVESNGLKGYLADAFGKPLDAFNVLDVSYDLINWAIITTNPANSEVLLRAEATGGAEANTPLAVWIKPKKGNVIYTTFHNEPAGGLSPEVEKAVEYFATIPTKDNGVNELLNQYSIQSESLMSSSALSLSGAKSLGIYVDSDPNGAEGAYLFKITGKFLSASASKNADSLRKAAASGGSGEVSLYKPDGTLYKEKVALDNSGSVKIDVPAEDNAKGAWRFQVDNCDGYSDDAMVIAASTKTTTPTKPTEPGTSGGGGGGCDAGAAGMAGALILAAVMTARRMAGKRG